MNNKFTLGAVAGVTSLLIAVPLAAQFVSAASSSSAGTSVPTTQSDTSSVPNRKADPAQGGHVGANGQREELLTGDTAATVTAAALAAVPGGTIDRVETDTEGDVYEAHMTKADGSRVTVKFDAAFNVTNIEEGRGRKR